MRIPSFYCLYPLVWRVSEEALYDNVTSSCSRMAEWGLWLYLTEFEKQVAEGVDKDTEDEEEPQLSFSFEKPVELIASLFQVSSPSEKEHNLPNNMRSLWVSFQLCQIWDKYFWMFWKGCSSINPLCQVTEMTTPTRSVVETYPRNTAKITKNPCVQVELVPL